MKRLLLILLFLSPVFCAAQTSVYHPFPDSNAVWCSFYGIGCYPCSCFSCYNEYSTFFLDGIDTINNTRYNRLLWLSDTDYFSCSFDPFNCNDELRLRTLHIRQDTSIKKVWIYDTTALHERTFYDFNLQVGDTLDSSKVYWGYPWSDLLIISSIDSILIDGNYRARYNYRNSSGDQLYIDSSMVEGIGPLTGLIYPPYCCFQGQDLLTRFSQNNQTLYSYTDMGYDTCYDFPTVIQQTVIRNAFTISPNPAHDKLNVECKLPNAELKIYDMTGRVVMEEKLRSHLSTFNFQLPAGVYVVRVTSGTSAVMVQKLIIE